MKFLLSLLFVSTLVSTLHADTLTLTMDTLAGVSGGQVEISIKAEGFINLAVLEGTIEWDSAGLSLVEVGNFGVENFTDDNFGRPNGTNNKVTFTWTEPSTEGKTAPDGTVIFSLLFDVVSTEVGTAIIHFADEPLDVTAANSNLEGVDVIQQDGLVNLYPALTVNVTTSDVSCFSNEDGGIDILASGATGNYSYLWNTGDTTSSLVDLEAGSYKYTVTDKTTGHELVDSAIITSPELLEVSLADLTEEGDTLGTISATTQGGTEPYIITWSDPAIIDVPEGLPSGTYSITVTDANGCNASDSITIEIQLPSSLKEIELSPVSIYPNPTSGLLTIDLSAVELDRAQVQKWQIFNALGKQTYEGTISHQGKLTIDLSSNAPGVYYFKLNKRSSPIILVR